MHEGIVDTHLMRLRARDEISPEEEAVIRKSVREVINIPARRTVVRAHQAMDVSMILLSGLSCRLKDLRDGRTQITQLHVTGDFTDLHSFVLKYLDHDVFTLSACSFALIPHERLKHITEAYPHLTRVYWFTTNLDAAMHREWELSLGRRSALARMAHLFCEMYVRLQLVGLVEDNSYELQLTQEQLANALGLTGVHVNRTLQEMRSREILDFRGGRVTIHNLPALEEVAEFDPAYLYLKREKR